MDVIFELVARTELKALPRREADRLLAALEQVAAEYPKRLSFTTEMQGEPGMWRLRKGDYRAIFRITGRAIEVVAIGHRKGIYR